MLLLCREMLKSAIVLACSESVLTSYFIIVLVVLAVVLEMKRSYRSGKGRFYQTKLR